jgi:hypothetical protein
MCRRLSQALAVERGQFLKLGLVVEQGRNEHVGRGRDYKVGSEDCPPHMSGWLSFVHPPSLGLTLHDKRRVVQRAEHERVVLRDDCRDAESVDAEAGNLDDKPMP